jgi:hypothetical protein
MRPLSQSTGAASANFASTFRLQIDRVQFRDHLFENRLACRDSDVARNENNTRRLTRVKRE